MANFWLLFSRTQLFVSCCCWICHHVIPNITALPVGYNCTIDQECLTYESCIKDKHSGWTSCRCTQAHFSCKSLVCKNGGTFQRIGDSFVCHCDLYWTGKNCETFKGLPDSPPISTFCSSSDYQCRDGSCVVGQSLCDGIPDCSDRSDEIACSSMKPNSQCAIWEFECEDKSCIPRYKCCDLFKDCQKGEDEINCITQLRDVPEQEPKPAPSPSGGSNLLIITCTVLMTVVIVTLLIYFRRVRSSQRRFYSPVSWTLNQHGEAISMPYHVSQHANFCHHLPPHRCPRINGLVGYPLSSGEQVPGEPPDVLLATLEMTGGPRRFTTSRDRSKDNEGDENDIPPTYSEVIKSDADTRRRGGDETPPPSYEDL
ncbi:low-density lipoprotein receptor class A domain-containing protein 3 [Strongylocentrotus purpuratus]|uniref:EGF-like domain-containing protein n=1 Tax=Strongylocentrotus purpuratus TaxID=7668 RepID=A0A7M7P8T6_STRPU|nr:low-density lipoprotein receptor class A domain-containing protein 3 [Strongylocentrotus purpuratus]|eukprot:XP_785176.2 PREDICTED: low-density lipoprotein receptor class A domain-containing protein 3-like [Strongylocentrotus purpuratus]